MGKTRIIRVCTSVELWFISIFWSSTNHYSSKRMSLYLAYSVSLASESDICIIPVILPCFKSPRHLESLSPSKFLPTDNAYVGMVSVAVWWQLFTLYKVVGKLGFVCRNNFSEIIIAQKPRLISLVDHSKDYSANIVDKHRNRLYDTI